MFAAAVCPNVLQQDPEKYIDMFALGRPETTLPGLQHKWYPLNIERFSSFRQRAQIRIQRPELHED